jgi:hypothetical protein
VRWAQDRTRVGLGNVVHRPGTAGFVVIPRRRGGAINGALIGSDGVSCAWRLRGALSGVCALLLWIAACGKRIASKVGVCSSAAPVSVVLARGGVFCGLLGRCGLGFRGVETWTGVAVY